MRNVKAIAAAGQLTTFVENPEIIAMAAICEILQALPDDGARMRVMRWSFGRFGDEFKRPLTTAPIEAVSTPAPVAPFPAPASPRLTVVTALKPVRLTRSGDESADLADQISELADLFGQETRARTSLA